jgi:thiamine-monophosphate kinase
VLRDGAKPGDEIWVSGGIGGAAAGLRTFLHTISVSTRLQDRLRQRYAEPLPRVREAVFLRAAGELTSLIDLSDGLAGDLGHICEESHVGARLLVETLPLEGGVREVAAALGEDPLDYALRGGEDFELCCTAPPGVLAPLADEFRAQHGILLTHIGSITPEPALRLAYTDGSETAIVPQAFDHFQA